MPVPVRLNGDPTILDDNDDGRTRQTALETLARALQIVRPGVTVRLLPGVYVESMEVTLRGLPGRPITITSEGGLAVLSGNTRQDVWIEAMPCPTPCL